MSKQNPRILKIFLYMLLLNFLFLCFYLAFHSSYSSPEPHPHIPLRVHNESANQKPWPILPSYLPWTPPQKNLTRDSCEANFGNGFTLRGDFLKSKVSKGSWFRCFYSETLQSMWVEEPTLLVTRYEDANLFHTVTDWYSAYVSSRVTGLPNRPHVVVIDGHCTFVNLAARRNMDSFVFRDQIRKKIQQTGLFSPRYSFTIGILTRYKDCNGESAHNLWQNPDDKRTARISEFGEMIRSAFGFPVNRHRSEEKPPSSSSTNSVLFIRREDYLAHPRYSGKVESRLINEEELFDSLHHWVTFGSTGLTKCGINLVNGLFAHMSMKDQVRAIQDASVIIGAGLTHIVSATPNTTIFEIASIEFKRPHYELIGKWKGLEYHAMHLANSRADPTAMIEKLKKITRSLGC